MFQIDKSEFGAFIAALRRERGMTQRELAEKVGVSDKAVSKWETGISLPDISLLPPLGEELGVTVTELLNCRRMDSGETLRPQETDELLRKALELTPEEGRRRPSLKNVLTFLLCAGASALEIALLMGPLEWRPWNDTAAMLWTAAALGAVFGAYFFLAVKTRLPGFYDENKLGYVIDGFLRIHMSGISINNANWPHMVKAFRGGSAAVLTLGPVTVYALDRLTPQGSPWRMIAFFALLTGSLLVPAYAAAIRHRNDK